jgi:hypothetical protein
MIISFGNMKSQRARDYSDVKILIFISLAKNHFMEVLCGKINCHKAKSISVVKDFVFN